MTNAETIKSAIAAATKNGYVLPGAITKSVEGIENPVYRVAVVGKFIKDSDKSSFLQNWMIKDIDHPYPAIRAAEVIKWFRSSPPVGALPNRMVDIGSAKLKW